MDQPLYCRQCASRLYPPARVKSVRCPHCGADSRLQPSGPGDPLAALTEPPEVAANVPQLNTPSDPDPAAGVTAARGLLAASALRRPNPFADDAAGAGPALAADRGAQEINPYSPSATITMRQDEEFLPASARVGLPWQQETTIRSWYASALRIVLSPTLAFRQMSVDTDVNGAISFAALGALAGWAIFSVAVAALPIVAAVARGGDPERAGHAIGFSLGVLLGNVFCGGIGVAIGAAIGAVLTAALYHFMLLVQGASRYGFGTTLLVVGFVHGVMLCALPIMAIPFVSILPSLWAMVLMVIGLREAQQTTTTKAVVAVVVPTVLCTFLFTAVVFARLGVYPFGFDPL